MNPSPLRADLPTDYGLWLAAGAARTKLDQNETASDLPSELKVELSAELAARSWNRYIRPDEYASAKAGLAHAFDLDPRSIALTVGGDQTIAAAFTIAGGPGRRAHWFEPTYPYLGHVARLTATEAVATVYGRDIDSRIDADVIDASKADLLLLVSPNNPTGGVVTAEAFEAARARRKGLVFLDEAYADFADRSYLNRVADRDNLVVGRSLSKAMLASVRLGFVAGRAEIITTIERCLTAPYHLNALQLVIARRYREIRPYVEDAARKAVAERERLYRQLSALPCVHALPSQANFVLVTLTTTDEAFDALNAELASAGIHVRDVSALPGLARSLRITVGTREENDHLLDVLRTQTDRLVAGGLSSGRSECRSA